jgi:hypothetical protein
LPEILKEFFKELSDQTFENLPNDRILAGYKLYQYEFTVCYYGEKKHLNRRLKKFRRKKERQMKVEK